MPDDLALDYDTYEAAREGFAWDVPDGFNAATDLVRGHDDPDRPALYQAYPDGRRETYSFADLDALSNRLAHGLAALGVGRGDRVAVVLPQTPANPLAHLACWKLGAVSLPLSVLFGDDALRYRLDDSGAVAVVADASVADVIESVRGDCPALEHVIVDGATAGEPAASSPAEPAADATDGSDGSPPEDDRLAFDAVHEGQPDGFDVVETEGDTPAVVMYTSGSTGPPKGVLHTHDVWLGHCPAFSMYFERDLDGSVCYTPADWAWIGALGDLVFPAWHFGRPVVGFPMGPFDAGTCFSLLSEFGVTDAFLPPTAIRMLMAVDDPAGTYDLSLEAICSGGEPLTPEILDWAAEELEGVVVNELYGQTEANLLVTNSRGWFDARPGSMGKPVPGHEVAVIDPETGAERPVGEVGEIAVRRAGDPVVFEEYWRNPEATAGATVDGWHLTGDLATRDADGYLWFKSRDDDLIITAGYRVGPGEVEGAILDHDDVAQVGVVGVPDETRGEIIKAFVQPVPGVEGTDALRAEIRDLVRAGLAAYEYPREIEFVAELPQTTTGKIKRRALRDREPGADR